MTSNSRNMSKKIKGGLEVVTVESAFKCRLLTLRIKNNLGFFDPVLFLREISLMFPNLVTRVNLFPCKINATLCGNFIIPKGSNKEESIEGINDKIMYINTKNEILYELANAENFF